MYCAGCRSEVPDKYVTCTVCAERKSRLAFLQHQRYYRQDILADRAPLLLGYIPQHQHIQFISGDPTHALCGERFHFLKRIPTDYSQLKLVQNLCESCAYHLAQIVKEAA